MNEIRQLEDEDELLSVGNTTIIPDCKDIVLENIHFQYTINAPLVLRNIYLKIPENKVTAIVGGSGSGKSTLLKLLIRLYKPSLGRLKLGDECKFHQFTKNGEICVSSYAGRKTF